MILWIDSSIPTFKRLEFHSGLNVLLADTTDGDDSGQTRNSAGKSSFVLIVDFLLGARCDVKSLFKAEALINAQFSGAFKFAGTEIHVERSGADPSRIFILHSDEPLGDEVEVDKETGRRFIRLNAWRRVLGHRIFALPSNPKDTDFSKKFAPTPRAMLKYFMRLHSDGGFLFPERGNKDQSRSSWQSCLSYFLGLEWRIPQRFQRVRDREKTLDTLRREATGDELDEMVGTVAKLRPQLALANKRADDKATEIANFQVLESYKELSDQAAGLRRDMQAATRRLISLKETLEYLRAALEEEQPHYAVSFEDMYRESQIQLPDLALRRLEEVEAFHASVVRNRKLHLESEIDAVDREIAATDKGLEAAGESRKAILLSLQGKGAFEDLVEMQRDLAKLEAERATLDERFKAAEALEGKKAELKVDRLELHRELQADHSTHIDRLSTIELRIRELIGELYADREGGFEIIATENGPEFNIHIEGDRGGGIHSVEIFCFDLAVSEMVRRLHGGPGFLIHDSHLFDGVDPRQIYTALRLATASSSDEVQYIVAMNSDVFEGLTAEPDDWLAEAVLPVRLSDEDETGGLFGFRFD